MGLRFRRSIKIAPGVRVNLNKKSASVTFGPKGLKHTVSTTGKATRPSECPARACRTRQWRPAGQRAGSTAPHLTEKQSGRPAVVHFPRGARCARYYVGKIGTGVIWTLTAGFFGIGWIVDIFTVALGGFYDVNGYVVRFHPTEAELAAAEAAQSDGGEDPAEDDVTEE